MQRSKALTRSMYGLGAGREAYPPPGPVGTAGTELCCARGFARRSQAAGPSIGLPWLFWLRPGPACSEVFRTRHPPLLRLNSLPVSKSIIESRQMSQLQLRR